MKPIIDLSKEYGIVLEGGGAKGAYQIGAWQALKEAGVKIKGLAGTSVGALNGALICMDDLENAKHIWENITYSQIMSVDDKKMRQIFEGGRIPKETMRDAVKDIMEYMAAGGLDVTPLKELIAKYVDEEKICTSPMELYVHTFSLDEMKEIEVDLKATEKDLIKDFLLASAYIFPAFKNEPLHGKRYMDGGAVNNVPIGTLVDKGYEDIIVLRIFGIGWEKKVKIPENVNIYTVAPRASLGNILDFDSRKTKRHIKLGYYDAMRMIYGLKGSIYYIDEEKEESYYLNQLIDLNDFVLEYLMDYYMLEKEPKLRVRNMTEVILPAIAAEMKLPKDWNYKELYLAMLEATAKLCRVQKYKIYTLKELQDEVYDKMYRLQGGNIPVFAEIISKDVLL